LGNSWIIGSSKIWIGQGPLIKAYKARNLKEGVLKELGNQIKREERKGGGIWLGGPLLD